MKRSGYWDYEYDKHVQEKIDMDPTPSKPDASAHLFEQILLMNEGQRIAGQIGRQQFARDVMAWIQRTGVHTFGAVPIGELIEMCSKESEK